jgi:hypothetical protein
MKNALLVIDKDIYDAIELVSEAEGGLSAGRRFESVADEKPCCVIGAMQYAGVTGMDSFDAYGAVERVLGQDPSRRFDDAHRRLSPSRPYTRLPWPEIAREANIIRGN